MYLRDIYVEKDEEVLYKLIQDYPLGILTTVIPSLSGGDGEEEDQGEWPLIQQTHLPWILERGEGKGLLKGHIARANPQSKQLVKLIKDESNDQFPEWNRIGDKSSDGYLKSKYVTVSFTHPIQSYVTPKYYIHSKPTHGKVVPTWNYSAVEVRGKLKIINEWNDEKLEEILIKLTKENEEKNLKNHLELSSNSPWKISDSPKSYIDILKKSIIGLELEIESIVGKFKMSQDREGEDLQGVLNGFNKDGTQMGKGMSEMVKHRASLKPLK